jgi:hypothetical protein
MPRRLLNLLTLFSLLLCVAATAMWVRSYITQDGWTYIRGSAGPGWHLQRTTNVGCNQGEMVVSETDHWTLAADDVGRRVVASKTERKDGTAGFYWHTTDTRSFYWNPARRGDPLWRRLGFQGNHLLHVRPVADLGYVQRSRLWRVGVPHWALALATGLPCALWFLRWRRRRRRGKTGKCPSCGYDLRATPDKCPECGKSPATRPALGTP